MYDDDLDMSVLDSDVFQEGECKEDLLSIYQAVLPCMRVALVVGVHRCPFREGDS